MAEPAIEGSHGIAKKNSRQTEARVQKILDLVTTLDVSETSVWSNLDELSSNTTFDGVYVDEDGVFLDGDSFKVVFEVSVRLKYGSGKDAISSGDTFPAIAEGRFDNGIPKLNKIRVETSSFFK